MKHVTSFCVEEKAEAISGLLQLQDIHESSRVIVVSADLAVDLHASFHADLHALLVGQGVFQTVAEDDRHREALPHLVWTRGGLGGPNTPHLAQIPMLGGIEAFEVLLGSARPEDSRERQWDERSHGGATAVADNQKKRIIAGNGK